MTALSEAPVPATNKQLSHPKYRPDIDGLRAIAVLSVVAFHAFPSLIQGGFVGVDVFFVISGFLISSIIFGSLEKNSFSFVDFYSRRVNRIFPALLLMMIATWSFGWFFLLTDEYTQLGKHMAGGAAFISNFVLMGEAGYFDNSADTKLLLHLWSLGIEEQFYLIWPLMAWAVWKFRINAVILIVLVGGISFALNIINVQSDPVTAFYSPQTRFWELLVGSALAYFTMNKPKLFPSWRGASGPAVRNIQSVVGILLLAVAFTFTTKNNQFPGWWAVLPTVGSALLIAAGPFSWLNKVVLSNRVLVWFGLLSFPLYLWHWPILAFVRIAESGLPSIEIRLGAVAASIGLAWLTYRLIEVPLVKIKPRVRSCTLLALMAIVGTAGYATYKLDGIPSRFPADIQKLADYKYEFLSDARGYECWVTAQDAYDGFNKTCFIDSGNKPGTGIMIWGDSHAARLYPGLKSVFGRKSVILQATRNSCPPILGFGDQICASSNKYILDSLKTVKPHTVILFAVWGRYGDNWEAESEKRNKLLHTISEIQASGISNIVVLGPAPEWSSDLPKILYSYWKHDALKRVPDRLAGNIKQEPKKVDNYFKEFMPKSQSKFLSVFDFLCSETGCVTHLPGEPAKLITWDYGHLTTDGATIVARKILDSGAINTPD